MRLLVDPPKRIANIAKHGLDPVDTAHFGWASARYINVRLGRETAIGRLHEAIVVIIFKRLGSEALSVTSLRPASRRSARSMERDRGYTAEDAADVSDTPEWTDAELARSKSFMEAFPDMAASLKDGVTVELGGAVAVRLDDDVLAHYRTFGEGWEARLNADLRTLIGLG